jgi:hypothetical protein
MVNVHEQWIHVKEKENRRRWWRVSLTASAANWISDYVSVWLSGLNERRASKRMNESVRLVKWSRVICSNKITSLSLDARRKHKEEQECGNQFFFAFSYVIVFFSTLSVHICMRTGSISWPWTMTTAFSFFFFFFSSTSYVWFYVQYKYEREKE